MTLPEYCPKDSAYRCFVLLYVYVLFANGAPFNPMSTTYV